jgi:L-ascorbate metabolism protein UlaG (beta-lactamase superfamily)
MEIVVIILCIIVGIVVLSYCVMRYYPTFGGKTSDQVRQKVIQSTNYANGKFINEVPTPMMDRSFKGTMSILRDFIKGNPQGRPREPLPVNSLNPLRIQGEEEAQITWFGHSALLVEVQGLTLLLDPMLGKAPSPFPLFGGKRYSKQLPIEIEALPAIDAILLSHDHYDHLDYGSIMQLKGKVRHFFVPLGVGAHLERWGISTEKITELNWWDKVSYEGLTLVSTPARHFSGRRLLNNDTTLWCSWVIEGLATKIFFSGDSGYGPHFKEIGDIYGPFDITLMECGQYDERWSGIHMMPEQSVQAQVDVKGKLMIPIHWGAFSLALHDWTDPIERALKAAKESNVAISTPRIGEAVWIGSSNYPKTAWWKH